MKKLGVSPRETLILEDNEHGIKAALASGAHLMTVQSIYDVTYYSIMERIESLNRGALK
jgi:beta-phosphoglucomutase-like phosphatase (HAD superfamily)